MRRRKQPLHDSAQIELFSTVWLPFRARFRLRVGDVIRAEDGLGLVIRVTESAAVILTNQRKRDFTTRFDKRVSFQPPPRTYRISPNAETEILNRKSK